MQWIIIVLKEQVLSYCNSMEYADNISLDMEWVIIWSSQKRDTVTQHMLFNK